MDVLYRYIFRGLGILMAVGMITILLLAIMSQARHALPPHARGTATGASR
jgi:hypothetical protein